MMAEDIMSYTIYKNKNQTFMQVKSIMPALMGAMLLLVSCKKEVADVIVTDYESGNMPTAVTVTPNVAGINSLVLFQLDDYDFNKMVAAGGVLSQQGAACSEVRVGESVVRNLDWFQYDQAAYVVAVPETDRHLASLQVCGLNDAVKHDYNNLHPGMEMCNLLLAGTNDGMNSAGVYIGVNVVPYGQMSTDGSTGDVNYKPADGARYSKCEPLELVYLTRLVLDHATSLKDAEDIIKGTPWKDSPAMIKNGFQFHWLVCTAEGSFVCEFINGKPQFIYARSTTAPDYGNLMTNFSNYLMANGGNVQSHGAGYERFDILKQNYGKATPEQLAKLAFYSLMYTVDYNDPNYMWSEYASDKYTAQTLIGWKNDPASRTGQLWDDFVQAYERNKATYNWRELGYDTDRTRGTWYTAHSSIWTINTRELVLDIEEQGTFAAKFDLKGNILAK